MTDISDTLAPNSDQLDAIDLLGGPRTFTIADVSRGSDEQPVQIALAEFPRPWRPGEGRARGHRATRRVTAAACAGRSSASANTSTCRATSASAARS